MVPRRGKKNPPSDNGGGKKIQRRSIESADHWAFLEEIEAPMWVDLSLEAQLMEQDIDDVWFHMSHPVHQMPSRLLKKYSFPCFIKEKENSDLLVCKSPKLPESVSRSRGKHYTSRKWVGSKADIVISEPHPIRELGGESLGVAMVKSVSSSSSTRSTITTDSSKKPSVSLPDRKRNSNLRASSREESSSSSYAASEFSRITPKPSVGGLKTTNLERALDYGGHRKSSSSKSSVGSSYSLGCQLDTFKSATVLKERRKFEGKEALQQATASKISQRQIPGSNSIPSNQMKSASGKACQELKLKPLNATRKPLSLINESRPVKDTAVVRPRQNAAVGKLNLVPSSNKENAIGGGVSHKIKASRQGTSVLGGNGTFKPKVKTTGGKPERNLTTGVSRLQFR